MASRNGQVEQHPLDPTRTPIKVRHKRVFNNTRPPSGSQVTSTRQQGGSRPTQIPRISKGKKRKSTFDPNEVVSGGMGGGLAVRQVRRKTRTTPEPGHLGGEAPSDNGPLTADSPDTTFPMERSPTPAPAQQMPAPSRRKKRRNAKREAKGRSWPRWISTIIPSLVEPCLLAERRVAAGTPLPPIASPQNPPSGATITPMGHLCPSCKELLSTSSSIIHCVGFTGMWFKLPSLDPTSRHVLTSLPRQPSRASSYCFVLSANPSMLLLQRVVSSHLPPSGPP